MTVTVTVGSSISQLFSSQKKNAVGAAWLKGYVCRFCVCVFCKIERYIFFDTRIAFAVGRITPFRYAMTFIAVILIDREGSWLLDRFLLFLLWPFPTTLSTCLYRVRCEGNICGYTTPRRYLLSANVSINGSENRLNSCARKICFAWKMDFDLYNAF